MAHRLRVLGCHICTPPISGRVEAAATSSSPSDPTLTTTLLPPGVPLQPEGGKSPRYRWHLGCILLKTPAISLPTGGHTHPSITVALDGTLIVTCAAVLDDSTPGKDCQICFRSPDGVSWSEPAEIAPSHFKPASVTSLGGTGEFECYSGTLNTLPDGRLLFSW